MRGRNQDSYQKQGLDEGAADSIVGSVLLGSCSASAFASTRDIFLLAPEHPPWRAPRGITVGCAPVNHYLVSNPLSDDLTYAPVVRISVDNSYLHFSQRCQHNRLIKRIHRIRL